MAEVAARDNGNSNPADSVDGDVGETSVVVNTKNMTSFSLTRRHSSQASSSVGGGYGTNDEGGVEGGAGRPGGGDGDGGGTGTDNHKPLLKHGSSSFGGHIISEKKNIKNGIPGANNSKDDNNGTSTTTYAALDVRRYVNFDLATIRRMWALHFIVGLIVVCGGMAANGGNRKYVRVEPSIIPIINAGKDCSKAYVNVHSLSSDDPSAFVCCDGNTYSGDASSSSISHHGWWSWLFVSYEEFLCTERYRRFPLASTLTSILTSWLLPLIPILLRVIIVVYEKLFCGETSRHHFASATLRRLVAYFLVMNFRGWALYLALNIVEDAIISSATSHSHVSGFRSGSLVGGRNTDIIDEDNTIIGGTTGEPQLMVEEESCWYDGYLYHRSQRDVPCYGRRFDFSDHVVLFFGHILPVMIFEMMFLLINPLWTEVRGGMTRSSSHHRLSSVTVIPVMDNPIARNVTRVLLGLGFVYVNFITFLAVHNTAAYFHTAAEVAIGYVISLLIQLPLGYLLCSDRWTRLRRFVGLPEVSSLHED